MTDRPISSNLITELRQGVYHGQPTRPLMERAADEIEQLRAALGNISRMKGHPDKVVVLMTLSAAIEIATKALSGDSSTPETKAPHSDSCATVVRAGLCDCGADALNGISRPPPFEPIIQCDTTTVRVKKLIEMNAVPDYVVRALLHERDSWRENYWMRMEQITAAGSAQETTSELASQRAARLLQGTPTRTPAPQLPL